MKLFDKMKDLVLGTEDEGSFESIVDENYDDAPVVFEQEYFPEIENPTDEEPFEVYYDEEEDEYEDEYDDDYAYENRKNTADAL